MTATRFTPGAISLSSSNHFAPMPYSKLMKPVALPPGRAKTLDQAGTDRIGNVREHDRNGPRHLQQRPHG